MSGTWVIVILLLFNVYVVHDYTLFEKGLLPLKTFGSKSYFFSSKFKVTYFDAIYTCNQMGMQLLSILSQEVDDFIAKIINDEHNSGRYWTSGNKLVDGNDWYWFSTAKLAAYTNWLPNEPNKLTTEQCIHLDRGKMAWNNLPCDYELNFICESLDNDDAYDDWQNVFMDPLVSPYFPIFQYGAHIYYVGKEEKLTYWDAHIFCNTLLMTLVNIDSKEENNYIYNYIRDTIAGTAFWSGGNTFLDSPYWYWLPSGKKLLYTNWMKGKPSHRNGSYEACIKLIYNEESGLVWTDEKCSQKFNFICKAPTDQVQKRFISGHLSDRSVINNSIDGSVPYYHIGKEKITYDQAIQKCNDIELKLVSLQNNAKQHAVNKAIKNSGLETDLFWTSGNINDDKKNWRWLSGDVITKSFWKPKQSNKTETVECLSIMVKKRDTLWYNAPCSYQYYYICE